MQYDRTGLPTFEKIPEEKLHYSTYFWWGCVAIIFLFWFFA